MTPVAVAHFDGQSVRSQTVERIIEIAWPVGQRRDPPVLPNQPLRWLVEFQAHPRVLGEDIKATVSGSTRKRAFFSIGFSKIGYFWNAGLKSH